jgi:hypothetical protein
LRGIGALIRRVGDNHIRGAIINNKNTISMMLTYEEVHVKRVPRLRMWG